MPKDYTIVKLRKLFYICSILIALLWIHLISNATMPQSHHIIPVSKSKKATKSQVRKQRSPHSDTLPQHLPRKQYLQHIANELGWISASIPCNLCNGYFKEPAAISKYPQPPDIKATPTTITAKGPTTFVANGVSILQEEVVISQIGRTVKADKAYIYRDGKTGKITKIILTGHIRMLEAGKLVVADKGTVTLYPKSATLINAAYHVYSEKPYSATLDGPFNAWGTAQHAVREPSGVIKLTHATYTICTPTNPAWEVSAEKITIDKKNNIGKAYSAVVRFQHIPIAFSPYYSFPLTRKRKTGFLTPRLGYSNRSGAQFGFPFYWNMAPNYDLTITPQYFTKRNFDINAYFRYISIHNMGDIFADYLPNDTEFENFRNNAFNTYSKAINQNFYAPYLNALDDYKNQRAFFSMTDMTSFDSNWSAHLNINYVTDPYYFQDFAGQIKIGSSTLVNQLLNRADLEYSGWHWNFRGMARGYQTLHQINQTQNPALDQYTRLPDFTANAYYSLPYLDFDVNTEYVYFTYQSDFTPNKPIGQRLHLRPGLSIPVYFDGDYFIPQVWLDATSYQVTHRQPGQVQQDTRLLPIVDVDSRFYFNNNFHIGKKLYTQTFEPHFYYLYIPVKNQDQLPNYDTVLLPFSFEQLFALNHFTGIDRLDNANQISLGLTSRILRNANNTQILRANLGVAYYITPSKVCLTAGCVKPERHWSPLTADLTYYLTQHWSMNGSIAWDPNIDLTNNGQAGIAYHYDNDHSVSVNYMFVHGNGDSIAPGLLSAPDNVYSKDTSEIVFSFTWPLTTKWSTVGSWSYNIVHHRSDSYFAGIQYDTCCWALRVVVQRAYVGSTVNNMGRIRNRFDNTYFFQLQLKGLVDLGTVNISQLLEKSYRKFNLLN